MAMNSEGIKLYASERLTDEDDGGGRSTDSVVIDGHYYTIVIRLLTITPDE